MSNRETAKTGHRIYERNRDKKHKTTETKAVFSSAKDRSPSFLIAHILNLQDVSKTRNNFVDERLDATEDNIQSPDFEDNLPSCFNTTERNNESKHEFNFVPQCNKAHEKAELMGKSDFFCFPYDHGHRTTATSVNTNLFSCPSFSCQELINDKNPHLGWLIGVIHCI